MVTTMTGIRLAYLCGYKGWLLAVTHQTANGFDSWAISPNGQVLQDHHFHSTETEALTAGRRLIGS